MMLSILLWLFPLTYVLSVIYAVKGVLHKNYNVLSVFFIAALPIYITTLSVLHQQGLDLVIPLFQYSKEVLILLTMGLLIYRLPVLPAWNWLDKIMFFYFLYTAAYILLPLGSFGVMQKLIAFKNISFFPLLYFIGRLLSVNDFSITALQKQVMLLAIVAAFLLTGELLLNTHFQTSTGYASFYEKYFLVDPAGNYGLSWTFEIEGGIKRFASFFANPLEHAASTLFTAGVLVIGFLSGQRTKEPGFFVAAFVASILSIVFALSRASLAGYLLVSYLFFRLIKKRKIIFYYHVAALGAVMLFIFFSFESSVVEFVLNTLNFTNSSSLSHLIEWVEGIEAIVAKPLGMGLGESGRVAGALGLNTGGENQLIVTGVQCGLLAILSYLAVIGLAIYQAASLVRYASGKAAQLGTLVFIIRIGLLIPMLTATVESYLFISYLGWFLTGLMSTAWSSLHNTQPTLAESRNTK
jgi:hypothetical protein